MKSIGKAAEFVSKAVGALRRKAGVLRARLLFLAPPRRRAAVLAGISRHIRALTTPRQPCQEKAAAQQRRNYCRGSRAPLAPADDEDDGVVPFCFPHRQLPAILLLVVQAVDGDADGGSDGGCTADSDWTLALRSLFDDDEGGHHRGGDDYLLAADDDEDDGEDVTSVIDVIRRRREGDGQEFRIEDEIDRAADMYITRVRRRMSKQLEELIVATGAGSASH